MPGLSLGLGLGLTSNKGVGVAPYSAEVTQFFDRLITIPTAPRQALYAALIDGLVADGLWSLIDELCVAGADGATFSTDLKSGAYTPSLGGLTYTADRGVTGAGSSVSYLLTGFNPSVADEGAAVYKRNSASFGVWQRNAAGGGAVNTALLRSAAYGNVVLWPRHSGTDGAVAINNTPVGFTNANDTSGLFVVSRTASNAYTVDRNGVQLAALTTASAAPENNEMALLYGSGTAVWQVAAWFFGAGLTVGQRAAVYARLQTYLAAIGAA